jgi:hypothetical protein
MIYGVYPGKIKPDECDSSRFYIPNCVLGP